MARPRSKGPTPGELEVLQYIWEHGPCTVRDVMTALNEERPRAYTTVMTMMKIMVDKGYLARRKDGGSFVYRPLVAEKATTGRMLRDLVKRAFNGSAAATALHLLESEDLDRTEIRQLRSILNRKSRESGK